MPAPIPMSTLRNGTRVSLQKTDRSSPPTYGSTLLFIFLLGVVQTGSLHPIVYKNWNGNLTTFPHDIPRNVNEISIRFSYLPLIDYIDVYPELYSLSLISISLTEIPDLSNVSFTLKYLNLFGNDIQVVESMPPCPNLIIIDLSSNALTRFPEVSALNSTLGSLVLDENDIRNLGSVPLMSNLLWLSLKFNRLAEFPDFSNVSSKLEELFIGGNEFVRIDSLENFPNLKLLSVGGANFSEFPDLSNVSSTLETLMVMDSNVSSVDYIPKMLQFKKLNLQNNYISQFPDFTNVSSTLNELDLSYNRLEQIDNLPEMDNLQKFSLEENLLDRFPDLSNVSLRLSRLDLSGNNIRYIPDKRMAPLKSLTYLDLRGNPISSLPNFCHVRNTLELALSAQVLTCDWRLAFLKIMERIHKIVFSEYFPHCGLPSYLASKSWHQITSLELAHVRGTELEPNDIKMAAFKRIYIKSWSCPFGTDVINNVSALRCGALCGERPDCLMFSPDQKRCILTHHKLGSSGAFINNHKWYIKYVAK